MICFLNLCFYSGSVKCDSWPIKQHITAGYPSTHLPVVRSYIITDIYSLYISSCPHFIYLDLFLENSHSKLILYLKQIKYLGLNNKITSYNGDFAV